MVVFDRLWSGRAVTEHKYHQCFPVFFCCVCLQVSVYVSNHFNHCIKLFASCGTLIGNKKFLFLFLYKYCSVRLWLFHCWKWRQKLNILVISWRSVILVEETRVSGENHRLAASHWQTLSLLNWIVWKHQDIHQCTVYSILLNEGGPLKNRTQKFVYMCRWIC